MEEVFDEVLLAKTALLTGEFESVREVLTRLVGFSLDVQSPCTTEVSSRVALCAVISALNEASPTLQIYLLELLGGLASFSFAQCALLCSYGLPDALCTMLLGSTTLPARLPGPHGLCGASVAPEMPVVAVPQTLTCVASLVLRLLSLVGAVHAPRSVIVVLLYVLLRTHSHAVWAAASACLSRMVAARPFAPSVMWDFASSPAFLVLDRVPNFPTRSGSNPGWGFHVTLSLDADSSAPLARSTSDLPPLGAPDAPRLLAAYDALDQSTTDGCLFDVLLVSTPARAASGPSIQYARQPVKVLVVVRVRTGPSSGQKAPFQAVSVDITDAVTRAARLQESRARPVAQEHPWWPWRWPVWISLSLSHAWRVLGTSQLSVAVDGATVGPPLPLKYPAAPATGAGLRSPEAQVCVGSPSLRVLVASAVLFRAALPPGAPAALATIALRGGGGGALAQAAAAGQKGGGTAGAAATAPRHSVVPPALLAAVPSIVAVLLPSHTVGSTVADAATLDRSAAPIPARVFHPYIRIVSNADSTDGAAAEVAAACRLGTAAVAAGPSGAAILHAGPAAAALLRSGGIDALAAVAARATTLNPRGLCRIADASWATSCSLWAAGLVVPAWRLLGPSVAALPTAAGGVPYACDADTGRLPRFFAAATHRGRLLDAGAAAIVRCWIGLARMMQLVPGDAYGAAAPGTIHVAYGSGHLLGLSAPAVPWPPPAPLPSLPPTCACLTPEALPPGPAGAGVASATSSGCVVGPGHRKRWPRVVADPWARPLGAGSAGVQRIPTGGDGVATLLAARVATLLRAVPAWAAGPALGEALAATVAALRPVWMDVAVQGAWVGLALAPLATLRSGAVPWYALHPLVEVLADVANGVSHVSPALRGLRRALRDSPSVHILSDTPAGEASPSISVPRAASLAPSAPRGLASVWPDPGLLARLVDSGALASGGAAAPARDAVAVEALLGALDALSYPAVLLPPVPRRCCCARAAAHADRAAGSAPLAATRGTTRGPAPPDSPSGAVLAPQSAQLEEHPCEEGARAAPRGGMRCWFGPGAPLAVGLPADDVFPGGAPGALGGPAAGGVAAAAALHREVGLLPCGARTRRLRIAVLAALAGRLTRHPVSVADVAAFVAHCANTVAAAAAPPAAPTTTPQTIPRSTRVAGQPRAAAGNRTARTTAVPAASALDTPGPAGVPSLPLRGDPPAQQTLANEPQPPGGGLGAAPAPGGADHDTTHRGASATGDAAPSGPEARPSLRRTVQYECATHSTLVLELPDETPEPAAPPPPSGLSAPAGAGPPPRVPALQLVRNDSTEPQDGALPVQVPTARGRRTARGRGKKTRGDGALAVACDICGGATAPYVSPPVLAPLAAQEEVAVLVLILSHAARAPELHVIVHDAINSAGGILAVLQPLFVAFLAPAALRGAFATAAARGQPTLQSHSPLGRPSAASARSPRRPAQESPASSTQSPPLATGPSLAPSEGATLAAAVVPSRFERTATELLAIVAAHPCPHALLHMAATAVDGLQTSSRVRVAPHALFRAVTHPSGWMVEQHTVTHIVRVLDPRAVRVAWGTEAAIHALLQVVSGHSTRPAPPGPPPGPAGGSLPEGVPTVDSSSRGAPRGGRLPPDLGGSPGAVDGAKRAGALEMAPEDATLAARYDLQVWGAALQRAFALELVLPLAVGAVGMCLPGHGPFSEGSASAATLAAVAAAAGATPVPLGLAEHVAQVAAPLAGASARVDGASVRSEHAALQPPAAPTAGTQSPRTVPGGMLYDAFRALLTGRHAALQAMALAVLGITPASSATGSPTGQDWCLGKPAGHPVSPSTVISPSPPPGGLGVARGAVPPATPRPALANDSFSPSTTVSKADSPPVCERPWLPSRSRAVGAAADVSEVSLLGVDVALFPLPRMPLLPYPLSPAGISPPSLPHSPSPVGAGADRAPRSSGASPSTARTVASSVAAALGVASSVPSTQAAPAQRGAAGYGSPAATDALARGPPAPPLLLRPTLAVACRPVYLFSADVPAAAADPADHPAAVAAGALRAVVLHDLAELLSRTPDGGPAATLATIAAALGLPPASCSAALGAVLTVPCFAPPLRALGRSVPSEPSAYAAPATGAPALAVDASLDGLTSVPPSPSPSLSPSRHATVVSGGRWGSGSPAAAAHRARPPAVVYAPCEAAARPLAALLARTAAAPPLRAIAPGVVGASLVAAGLLVPAAAALARTGRMPRRVATSFSPLSAASDIPSSPRAPPTPSMAALAGSASLSAPPTSAVGQLTSWYPQDLLVALAPRNGRSFAASPTGRPGAHVLHASGPPGMCRLPAGPLHAPDEAPALIPAGVDAAGSPGGLLSVHTAESSPAGDPRGAAPATPAARTSSVAAPLPPSPSALPFPVGEPGLPTTPWSVAPTATPLAPVVAARTHAMGAAIVLRTVRAHFGAIEARASATAAQAMRILPPMPDGTAPISSASFSATSLSPASFTSAILRAASAAGAAGVPSAVGSQTPLSARSVAPPVSGRSGATPTVPGGRAPEGAAPSPVAVLPLSQGAIADALADGVTALSDLTIPPLPAFPSAVAPTLQSAPARGDAVSSSLVSGVGSPGTELEFAL